MGRACGKFVGPKNIRKGVTFDEMTRDELLEIMHWIVKEAHKVDEAENSLKKSKS